MGEKHDIKETKEAIVALLAIGVFVAKRAKGGLDLSDLAALLEKLKDDEFLAVVKAGVEGIEHVDDEIKDLDLSEGLELAGFAVPKLLDAVAQVKAG
jgi:hypothetical protein